MYLWFYFRRQHVPKAARILCRNSSDEMSSLPFILFSTDGYLCRSRIWSGNVIFPHWSLFRYGHVLLISTASQGTVVILTLRIVAYQHHKNAITRIIHAPMSFFDTTPLGRIMNIFSKDTDTIDNELGGTVSISAFSLTELMLIIFRIF